MPNSRHASRQEKGQSVRHLALISVRGSRIRVVHPRGVFDTVVPRSRTIKGCDRLLRPHCSEFGLDTRGWSMPEVERKKSERDRNTRGFVFPKGVAGPESHGGPCFVIDGSFGSARRTVITGKIIV